MRQKRRVNRGNGRMDRRWERRGKRRTKGWNGRMWRHWGRGMRWVERRRWRWVRGDEASQKGEGVGMTCRILRQRVWR